MMKHQQKLDCKLGFPLIKYDYWMCMHVDSLNEYTCHPNCVDY